jgi:hypothetical protein
MTMDLYSAEECEQLFAAGAEGEAIHMAWLLGYFLRVSEQYSPKSDLFEGAREYIYED